MDLFNILTELGERKYNHRMIVRGIHGERVIVPLSLPSYICATVGNRDYFAVARHSCKFPIKEVILNRYNKKLTDEQYSALLTLILHCREYDTPALPTNVFVHYKSSVELKYDAGFKDFMDKNVEFAENVYGLGFDTGEISFVTEEHSAHKDIMAFFTVALVHATPDEYFAEDITDPNADVETIGEAEDE